MPLSQPGCVRVGISYVKDAECKRVRAEACKLGSEGPQAPLVQSSRQQGACSLSVLLAKLQIQRLLTPLCTCRTSGGFASAAGSVWASIIWAAATLGWTLPEEVWEAAEAATSLQGPITLATEQAVQLVWCAFQIISV